jgi:hypothetical protein
MGSLSGKLPGALAGVEGGPLSGQEDAGAYEPPIAIREPHPGGPPGLFGLPVQLDLFGAVPFRPALPAAVPRPTAAERVAQLAEGGLSRFQRERCVTLAVTETKEGGRVISSSSGKLEQSVLDLLQKGEFGVNGGRHAEKNGVDGARSLGLTPTGVAAHRPICED